MGATNCPETPRQKMITMMYLVYTAMLALNVSAEVIQGFKSVGTAMHDSNKNIAAKLEDTYQNFDLAYKNSPDKVREMYERAQEIKNLSNEITTYIDSMECEFIGSKVASSIKYKDPGTKKEWELLLRDESGKAIQENVRLALDSIGFAWFTDKQLEDNHAPAQFFIGGDVKNPDPELGAIKIKNKLSEFIKKVNSALGDDSSHVKMALNLSDGYDKEGKLVPWEVLNFNEVITGAALVTLTRLKSETMNAEYDAVNMLYKKVSKGDKSFSDVAMISRPRSTYILQGGIYETRINVAAYDSKQKFKARINGQEITSGDSGTVVYRTTCNTLGQQRITGTAYVTSPDGGTEEYPINDVYFVANPAGVVRLDGMQVVYAGLDNPITISAAGMDTRMLKPVIEGGQYKLTKLDEEGKYNLVPAAGSKKLTINVEATVDKKVQRIGSQTVFVKDIPAPVIKVGGIESGGRIAKKDLSANTVVTATKAKDFNLKIDNRLIRIMKMTVAIGAKEETVNNGRFNETIASMIRKATKGDKLVLLVEVMMPDGKAQTVTYTATLK